MKRLFTPEEVTLLSRNPNIYSASPHELHYTNAFKMHFMERYLSGCGPAEIFSEAGLPAQLIGYKRIERACYHWKRAYEEGTLADQAEQVCRPDAKQTLMQIITEQQRQIRNLEKALSRAEQPTAKRPVASGR